jgi:hypothetical protein
MSDDVISKFYCRNEQSALSISKPANPDARRFAHIARPHMDRGHIATAQHRPDSGDSRRCRYLSMSWVADAVRRGGLQDAPLFDKARTSQTTSCRCYRPLACAFGDHAAACAEVGLLHTGAGPPSLQRAAQQLLRTSAATCALIQ